MTRSSVKFPRVCARPKQAWHDRAGSRARNDASPLHIHFYASARSFKACFAVGGFHEFIFDPTTNPEQRWIYSFTPWISPGVFGGGVQDVTSLSHETSAALNDPFGNNIVPTRQFPVFPDFARQTWRLATLWNCFPPALYPSRSRNGAKYSSITPRPRRCSSGVKSATLPTPSEAHTVIPTQPLFP